MAATNKKVQLAVWGLLAATVAAIALAFFLSGPKSAPLPVLGALQEFTLQSQDNRPVHLADLRGKIWVADVIFTRCGSQCPLMTTHLKAIQDQTSPPIQFVSLTTDPAFDTPPILKKYAQRYAADESRWLFLTGDKPTLRRVIVDQLKLPDIEKAGGPQDDPNDLFVHSAKFVLLDRAGQIRGYFDGETEAAIAQVSAAATRLTKEP